MKTEIYKDESYRFIGAKTMKTETCLLPNSLAEISVY